MKRRILVIGGLAAGPSAASKAKRVNPDAEVILFEQGEYISYGICELPYYIAGIIKDRQKLIVYTPDELKEKKGVDVRIFHRVEEIVPVQKKILVQSLDKNETQEYKYDKLILAIGSASRRLSLDGEDARNVFFVKSLVDGYKIKEFIEQEHPRKAIIIGGGYIGMEIAEALTCQGIETTILHRSELPMAGLELETRQAVKEELIRHYVNFVHNTVTRSLSKDGSAPYGFSRVRQVITSKGAYETDLLILSLGVEPRVDLAKDANLALGTTGAIKVDEKQLTSNDNIYAAGDCAEIKNLVSNRSMYLPLATVGSKAAWVAGENAAGGSATFKGGIRAIAVKVFDLEVAQVGLSSEEAKNAGYGVVTEIITGSSKVAIMPDNRKITIKIILDKKSKRLLGANVFGADGAVHRANVLAVAIQHKLTVDQVSQLDLAYAPPFSPLWDAVLIAANVAKRQWK